MNATSLVSVLMTAYNRQHFIAEAIESVMASTYQNWELIIVDDGSSDNTVSIAKSYEARDDRIKVYVNEKNMGDYPNRNKAAAYAKGDYLMYCDSDDQFYANSIQKTIDVIQQFPDMNYGLNSPLKIQEPVYQESSKAIKKHFFESPLFMYGPGATIIKRTFFNDIGGFPEKYGPANDMYYHLKVASKTGVVLIPFQLINYRRHEGQEINNQTSYLYNNYLYLKDALVELHLPLLNREIKYLRDKNRRRFITNLYKYFIKTGKPGSVLLFLRKARFSSLDFFAGIFHVYLKKPGA